MPDYAGVISEAVLTATSWYNVLYLHNCLNARLTFALIGVASIIGAIRFASDNPGSDLIFYHTTFSRMSRVIGFVLLAYQYAQLHDQWNIFVVEAGTSIIIYLFSSIFIGTDKAMNISDSIVNILAILVILLCSILGSEMFGAAAIGVTIVAAGVNASGVHLLGMKPIDWFHYLLAAGNILHYLALTTLMSKK